MENGLKKISSVSLSFLLTDQRENFQSSLSGASFSLVNSGMLDVFIFHAAGTGEEGAQKAPTW